MEIFRLLMALLRISEFSQGSRHSMCAAGCPPLQCGVR